MSFVHLRMAAGAQPEAARAVLAERSRNPALACATAEALTAELAASEQSPLPRVLQALSRPMRIVRGKDIDTSIAVDEGLFEGDAEGALYAALQAARRRVTPDITLAEWLQVAQELVSPIDRFFDEVFVMAEDEALRRNRLALLQDVVAVTAGVLDLAELPGF